VPWSIATTGDLPGRPVALRLLESNDTPVVPGTGLCPASRGSQSWTSPDFSPGQPMIAQDLVVAGSLRSDAKTGCLGERRGGPGAARDQRERLQLVRSPG